MPGRTSTLVLRRRGRVRRGGGQQLVRLLQPLVLTGQQGVLGGHLLGGDLRKHGGGYTSVSRPPVFFEAAPQKTTLRRSL